MKKSNYLIASFALLLFSCNPAPTVEENETINTEEQTTNMEKTNTSTPTLLAALTAKKENFEIKATEDKKQKYAAGLQAVIDQGVVENAIQLGDKAPNFTLSNAEGSTVTLYEELEKGPVVLMWYRGGWCPYCNITLNHMQAALPSFKKYGANLLALTPELPDSSISTTEKNELEFEVLSDVGNVVANDYKVVFSLTEDVKTLYENGFGLSSYNGNSNGELPLAVTYVIGQDKIVKYAFLDPDYRNRAEPSEIVEVLKTLKK